MQQPEIEELLGRSARRQSNSLKVVLLVLLIMGSIMVTEQIAVSWMPPGYCISVCIYLWITLAEKRRSGAVKVSRHPWLVYWAHTSGDPRFPTDDLQKHDKTLVMHCRDGTKVAVRLEPEQLRQFAFWLFENNSDVRWGPYDDTDVNYTKGGEEPA